MFTFLTEKKNCFGTSKKFVYLIFINKLSLYHPKITYENTVKKDMNNLIIYDIRDVVTKLEEGPWFRIDWKVGLQSPSDANTNLWKEKQEKILE